MIFNKLPKSLIYVSFFASIVLSCNTVQSKHKQRPNIVLIMADDMGYSDIGSFGGEIETPNIDQLSKEGIRLTQFYNTSRCCPSRASLLTGRYAHEAGMGWMTTRNSGDGYLGFLNNESVTIAEVLKNSGYQTNMVGKWHVGANRESWPENRGFERFYGIHHYIDSYFQVLKDSEVFENGKMVISATKSPVRTESPEQPWYTTDVFTDKALQFVDESLKGESPFFLYVAYNAPHWPLEAPPEVIEKHLNKYLGGWDSLRQVKYQRMIEMGILNPDWNLSDPNEMTRWNTLSDSVKLNSEYRRAVYAAQIDVLDQNIGRITKHLKESGVYDNTIFIFLSDNGSSGQPLEEFGGANFSTNTRWNTDEWKYKTARTGASQGVDWALASNTPFKKYKKFTHEGGIAAPLIISWAGNVKTPGSLVKTPAHIIDLAPTIYELTNAEYPTVFNGNSIAELSGISLASLLRDEESDERASIFWEHETHAAVRNGKWKLVTLNAQDSTAWELYDMDSDRTETTDLSSKHPKIADQLEQEWMTWAISSKVIPWPTSGKRNPIDK